MHARHAFLLGEGISHSLSPAIHNAGFAALDLDLDYGLLDVTRDGLPAALERLRRADCAGCNVTMPYKPDAAVAAGWQAPEVQTSGVANLLLNHDGRLRAHNVDIAGIVSCFERRRQTIAAGRAVVLGSGGAAAAALVALGAVPPKAITVAARNTLAARRLIQRLRLAADITPLGEIPADTSLIFNSTPLGMKPEDPSPIAEEDLGPTRLVYDIVYSRSGATPLQAAALHAGSPVCDGLTHLLAQAIPTFRLLTGHDAPTNVLERALQAAIGGLERLDWGSDSA